MLCISNSYGFLLSDLESVKDELCQLVAANGK
jgi:hypothetical protein